MSEQIERIPKDDDRPEDELEIIASPRPKAAPDEIDRATAILEANGGAGHIDLEEERARLKQRAKAREKVQYERARKVLAAAKGKVTEEEMMRRFEEAGVFEGCEEDLKIAATIKLIELSRVRNN